MKKITCLVADDEKLAREIILDYIDKTDKLEVVAECGTGTEVFNLLLRQTIDLIFLDIQLPYLSGIELLRSSASMPPVIITTAYSEFALEGYAFNVVDYLLKPIPFDRFLKAIQKYLTLYQPSVTLPPVPQVVNNFDLPFLYVKSEKKMVKIYHHDILWIEGMKDYVSIYTTDRKVITHQTLNSFEETLPATTFLRVHRSYIVGLPHVTAFTARALEIGNKEIPIGESYLKIILQKLEIGK
jgi:DNA-binding LytR/AlgR family response regulator